MINERLKQINAESESNTEKAEKALKGEKITLVFKPDEWTTVFIMETGSSFELKSDGSFRILSTTITSEIIPIAKRMLERDWEEYNEIKDLSFEKKENNG